MLWAEVSWLGRVAWDCSVPLAVMLMTQNPGAE